MEDGTYSTCDTLSCVECLRARRVLCVVVGQCVRCTYNCSLAGVVGVVPLQAMAPGSGSGGALT